MHNSVLLSYPVTYCTELLGSALWKYRDDDDLIWITLEADPEQSTRAHGANLGGAENTSRMEGGDPGDKCF